MRFPTQSAQHLGEQLAGFYLIDAEDHDKAVEVAARIPPARVGSIEVRHVRELQP